MATVFATAAHYGRGRTRTHAQSAGLRAKTEAAPPKGRHRASRGTREPPPHRGSPRLCSTRSIISGRPRFTRPLSGGSSRHFTRTAHEERSKGPPEGAARAAPSRLLLFGRRLFAVRRRGRFVGRHRHLLGRDLARDEGDVHVVARLAVVGARARDEDRRARLELAPEHEVRERILDIALDRAA